MLAIRLQRTGRSGHAQFRIVVQDSHLSPKSGKVVATLGSYNPHTKVTTFDKEKTTFYLENGAQPSDRVINILRFEGVKLPKWVSDPIVQAAKTRNPEKLRKNQPAKPAETSEPEASYEPEAGTPAEVEKPEVAEAEPEQPTDVGEATEVVDEEAKA